MHLSSALSGELLRNKWTVGNEFLQFKLTFKRIFKRETKLQNKTTEPGEEKQQTKIELRA